jgi:hypothetical protein
MGGSDSGEFKRRVLPKDPDMVDSPRKHIEQPSKNLKDYDYWDDDLEPLEWLNKYIGTPPPHGQSPIYSHG